MERPSSEPAYVKVPDPPKPGDEPTYEDHVDTGGQGLIRRFLAVTRHGYGLALGGLAAYLRDLPRRERTARL